MKSRDVFFLSVSLGEDALRVKPEGYLNRLDFFFVNCDISSSRL